MSSNVLLVDRPVNGENYGIMISFKKMKELGLTMNNYVLVSGNDGKKIICRVQKCDGKIDKALLNRINRHNLGINLNDAVTILPCIDIPLGLEVTIGIMDSDDNNNLSKECFRDMLCQYFSKSHRIVCENNKFVVRGGMRALEFVILRTVPKPYCIVDYDQTDIRIQYQKLKYKDNEKHLSEISYDDIGGFNGLLTQIRSSVECPLRFPSLFITLKEKDSVESPRVIFYGPHGCGKVLTAQAIATETRANFILMNEKKTSGTPTERIDKIKHYFKKACNLSPSVLCIDDLEYFFPKNFTTEESTKIGRVLIKLMIELNDLKVVVVLIGIATDIQNVHPTACEFFKNTNTIDRRFKFKIPDISGRIQILMIHTRNLNLADNFSITDLASMTPDFTPAKLAYLCKKVAYRNNIINNISTGSDENDVKYLFFKQRLRIEDFKETYNYLYRSTKKQ